jgi:hypothetical protein
MYGVTLLSGESFSSSLFQSMPVVVVGVDIVSGRAVHAAAGKARVLTRGCCVE